MDQAQMGGGQRGPVPNTRCSRTKQYNVC